LVLRGTTNKKNVADKSGLLTLIYLLEAIDDHLGNTGCILANERWVEENLRCHETSLCSMNDTTIGHSVSGTKFTALTAELRLVIKSNVANLLLKAVGNITLRAGAVKEDAILSKKLCDVSGDITTGNFEPAGGVLDGNTINDWDAMANTITTVKNDTGGLSRRVHGESSLG